MWHKATEELQRRGKVQVVGIAQELHPDRARLFMQWQRVDWPLLVDALDVLNLETVPITVAVDEYGIVRFTELPMSAAKTIGSTFVNQTYQQPAGWTPVTPPALTALRVATSRNTAQSWRAYGDALAAGNDDVELSDAIEAYRHAVRLNPEDGPARFRLGSALRKRYDSPARQPGDFHQAEQQWERALDLEPNRYIWRRRVQQYGPRLAEPVAFFDWIRDARAAIVRRGETPLLLAVEPGDSEFAASGPSTTVVKTPKQEPDIRGRIQRDNGEFVSVEAVAVPPYTHPGEPVRVHLTFRLNRSTKAHWNNEVGPLVVWVNAPAGWTPGPRAIAVPNARTPVSQEDRLVEFEIKAPAKQSPGTVNLPGYALYYVCEDVKGVCVYRRRDISVPVQIVTGKN